MADDLIKLDFTVNENTLATFGESFKDATKTKVRKGLSLIKRGWQAELVRQQKRLQGVWMPLKKFPAGKSYFDRKQHDYYSHKSKGGAVRFLSVLKRTGQMMDKYVNGIQVDNVNLTINIPYPNIAAKSHQEGPLPTGVLAIRPFETEKFEDIAINIMSDTV